MDVMNEQPVTVRQRQHPVAVMCKEAVDLIECVRAFDQGAGCVYWTDSGKMYAGGYSCQ